MNDHPLDSFLKHLEKGTPDGVCPLCSGSGEVMYKGMYYNFMDECGLCKGTGKSKQALTRLEVKK
jgi:DnaJ-class molecular chaperone